MEEVIYKHETNGEFTGIYAQIEDGKLTITEQDMGQGRRIKLNFPSTACLSSPHSILLSVVLD